MIYKHAHINKCVIYHIHSFWIFCISFTAQSPSQSIHLLQPSFQFTISRINTHRGFDLITCHALLRVAHLCQLTCPHQRSNPRFHIQPCTHLRMHKYTIHIVFEFFLYVMPWVWPIPVTSLIPILITPFHVTIQYKLHGSP